MVRGGGEACEGCMHGMSMGHPWVDGDTGNVLLLISFEKREEKNMRAADMAAWHGMACISKH